MKWANGIYVEVEEYRNFWVVEVLEFGNVIQSVNSIVERACKYYNVSKNVVMKELKPILKEFLTKYRFSSKDFSKKLEMTLSEDKYTYKEIKEFVNNFVSELETLLRKIDEVCKKYSESVNEQYFEKYVYVFDVNELAFKQIPILKYVELPICNTNLVPIEKQKELVKRIFDEKRKYKSET